MSRGNPLTKSVLTWKRSKEVPGDPLSSLTWGYTTLPIARGTMPAQGEPPGQTKASSQCAGFASRLSDAEFLGEVAPSFLWPWRKLLRHHGRVTETCPHPSSPLQDEKLTEAQHLPTPVWQTGFLPSSPADPGLHRQCLLSHFNYSSSLRTGRSKHQLFLLEERPWFRKGLDLSSLSLVCKSHLLRSFNPF